jgi:hypothetical protein
MGVAARSLPLSLLVDGSTKLAVLRLWPDAIAPFGGLTALKARPMLGWGFSRESLACSSVKAVYRGSFLLLLSAATSTLSVKCLHHLYVRGENLE